MNGKIKLILCLIVALILSVGLFASCNGGENDSDSVSVTEPDSESQRESIKREYEVGEKLLLNDFESVDDLYNVKQTNLAYDTRVKMNISAEQKKSGEKSLKYTYIGGGNPMILQRLDRTEYTDLDFGIISSTSLWIYSTAENSANAKLHVITTGNIALLSSEAVELKSGEWTEVSFDIDAYTRTKNKANIVGIAVELAIKGNRADYYIDDWTITIGNAVTNKELAAPVVSLIDKLPAAEDAQNLNDYMKILSAKGAYDSLEEVVKAEVTNYAKLEECIAKTEGYGLLVNAATDLFSMITTSGSGYDWSGVVMNSENDEYGSVIRVDVISLGTGNIMELSHAAFENAAEYDKVIFYVYNPIGETRTLIYATNQGWSGRTTQTVLQPLSWTKVEMPIKDMNEKGGFMLVQKPKAEGWLFSSFIAVKADKRAAEVSAMIDGLPALEELTSDHREQVEKVKAEYDSLSDAAKSLVTNADKLKEAVKTVIYGESVKPVIAAISELKAASEMARLEDVYAVEKARRTFDELPDEAKEIVSNAETLFACEEKAAEILKGKTAFEELVNSVTGENLSDEELFRALTAKSMYEAMTSEIKNSLGSEIKSKYEAIAAKTEGYILLSDAMSGSLITSPAPGDYTNVSVVRNAFDKTYGATYALKIKEPHAATGASSFKPYGSLDTKGVYYVMFYIQNNTGAWQNLIAYWRTDWKNGGSVFMPGSYQVEEGGADSNWTKVGIPVEKFYSEDDVFFVLNGAGANFEGDVSHPVTTGTWTITSFIGITEDKYFELQAEATVKMIDGLPAAGEITDLTHKTAIQNAKNSYDALSDKAKAKVGNAAKLEECVNALNEVIGRLANNIIDMIADLPEAETLTKDNFGTYRAAISAAMNAYTTAQTEVKEAVINYAKLEALNAKVAEFNPLVAKELIAALPDPDKVQGTETALRILGVKSFYDSLTAVEKALVDNSETLELYAEKVAKYKKLLSAVISPNGILSGRDTGNKGEVGTILNDLFGYVWTLNVTNAANGDFHAAKTDATGCLNIAFAIYNPTSVDIGLVCYTASWGNGKVIATAKSKQWTTVYVDVSVYGSDFFIIINDAKCNEGTWFITDFVGITEKEEETEKVILAADDAAKLAGGRDTGNAATIGLATDETYGKVWTLQSANAATTDFHAEGLDASAYAKVVFRIYNPLGEDVRLVLYTKSWGSQSAITMKAGEWTEITVDVATYGSTFFCVIDTAKSNEGMWKISSFIGVPVRTETILEADDAAKLAGGRDTGNAATIGLATDETYGKVWTLQSANAATTDFHAEGLDASAYAKVVFRIYNPLGEDVRLVLYTKSWGSQSAITMKAGEWTEITVDVATYGSTFFCVIDTAKSNEGVWKITSFTGISQ